MKKQFRIVILNGESDAIVGNWLKYDAEKIKRMSDSFIENGWEFNVQFR